MYFVSGSINPNFHYPGRYDMPDHCMSSLGWFKRFSYFDGLHWTFLRLKPGLCYCAALAGIDLSVVGLDGEVYWYFYARGHSISYPEACMLSAAPARIGAGGLRATAAAALGVLRALACIKKDKICYLLELCLARVLKHFQERKTKCISTKEWAELALISMRSVHLGQKVCVRSVIL